MPGNDVAAITGHLPGFHCGACGFSRCDRFAEALAEGTVEVSACRPLEQERFKGNRELISKALTGSAPPAGTPIAAGRRDPGESAPERPVGLLDGYEADFVLAPLGNEEVCREILLPVTPRALEAGEVIRYRPLGCPIVHFARILEIKEGLLVVHMTGPRHRLGDEGFRFIDIGLCMVIGFEGDVRGRMPAVGQTVRFLPAECMMQKVHSGVVVNAEGRSVRIEGLDLKVWAPPIRRTPS